MGKLFRKIVHRKASATIARIGCTKIQITLAVLVLLLAPQPAARASNLYSFTWTVPSTNPFYPSSVSWSFSAPSPYQTTVILPASALLSQSVTGTFATLGCKIGLVEIASPAVTGTSPTPTNSGWATATQVTGCSNSSADASYDNLGYPIAPTTNGSFTQGNATITIGPSIGGLAQVAFGTTLTTGFYITNTGTSSGNYSLSFYGDNGAPLALPFATGLSTTLSGTLSPYGSAYFEAGNDPQTPSTPGWALVSADVPVVVQGLFRNLVNGIDYEAAIPSTTAGSHDVLFPFDDTTFAPTDQPIVTGIALANFDSVNAANVACMAFDVNGNTIPGAITVPALPPLGHWSGYQFPLLVGQHGTIECTANTNITAVSLRFVGYDLSSLPVIAK